jgi:hypothetical protein
MECKLPDEEIKDDLIFSNLKTIAGCRADIPWRNPLGRRGRRKPRKINSGTLSIQPPPVRRLP